MANLSELHTEALHAAYKAVLIFFAALAVVGYMGFLLGQKSDTGPALVPVVVAARSVAPLSLLKPEDLRIAAFPSDSVPTGAFRQIDGIFKQGHFTITSMVAGQPLLKSMLTTSDHGAGLAKLIPPGMRAYAIAVPDTVANSQMIHPNAYVDVLLTTYSKQEHRPSSVSLLLQRVRVLAVGDRVEIERSGKAGNNDVEAAENAKKGDSTASYRYVTLLLSIKDTSRLVFARELGMLDLALRADDDTEMVKVESTTEIAGIKTAKETNPEATNLKTAPASTNPRNSRLLPLRRSRRPSPRNQSIPIMQ